MTPDNTKPTRAKTALSVIDLPVYDTPVFEEKQGKEWVEYGRNDEYGTYLEQLYLGSSIHSAVVNGVAAMIYGEGLDATDKEDERGKEQWLRLQTLLLSSEPDVLRKAAMDLKLYGQCYFNVIWNTPRTRVVEMRHLPVHTLRAGVCDSEGKVKLYYYKPDWSKKNSKPDVIKSFCPEDRTEASRVLHVKRYSPSFHYYGVPDYVGSTGYVELDNKIQTFHLNNIKNGLFPSMMISFNNGVPTDEEQRLIEAKVNDKFGGAEGAGKVLITFNDGTETQPSFTPVANNGTDTMYEYLSREVNSKVLSGHRVTSPLLFGVRGDGTGFGNNAQEMVDAYSLLHHSVIVPFQRMLLDGLGPVFESIGVSLNLYFKPLKPAGFLAIEEGAADVTQSYTGIQVSSALDIIGKQVLGELSKEQAIQLLITMLGFPPEVANTLFETQGTALPQVALSEVDLSGVAEWLIEQGEDVDSDEWEMIDSRPVNYEMEATHDALWQFASVPSSAPDEKSKQDRPLIKVRYMYAPQEVDMGAKGPSRDFCRKMVGAAKVFRKEDIEAAKGANPGFGKGGASTYDVFLYKGGPRCHHWWQRVTYLRKDNKRISVRDARKLIASLPPAERKKNTPPVNPKEVAMWPNDMDYKGFHPDNPKKPADARAKGSGKQRES